MNSSRSPSNNWLASHIRSIVSQHTQRRPAAGALQKVRSRGTKDLSPLQKLSVLSPEGRPVRASLDNATTVCTDQVLPNTPGPNFNTMKQADTDQLRRNIMSQPNLNNQNISDPLLPQQSVFPRNSIADWTSVHESKPSTAWYSIKPPNQMSRSHFPNNMQLERLTHQNYRTQRGGRFYQNKLSNKKNTIELVKLDQKIRNRMAKHMYFKRKMAQQMSSTANGGARNGSPGISTIDMSSEVKFPEPNNFVVHAKKMNLDSTLH